MQDIRIDVGVDTILDVDLSKINFEGVEKVIFTIKNVAMVKSEEIVEREFVEPKVYKITISAEESVRLQNGAEYDFQQLNANGTRTKITDNGKIVLRRGVGDKID